MTGAPDVTPLQRGAHLPITRQYSKEHCMDVGLTNSIVSTSTALASRQTSDAINITVLKRALDVQASAAATLLQALPQPALATSGTLGTQVNTFA